MSPSIISITPTNVYIAQLFTFYNSIYLSFIFFILKSDYVHPNLNVLYYFSMYRSAFYFLQSLTLYYSSTNYLICLHTTDLVLRTNKIHLSRKPYHPESGLTRVNSIRFLLFEIKRVLVYNFTIFLCTDLLILFFFIQMHMSKKWNIRIKAKKLC